MLYVNSCGNRKTVIEFVYCTCSKKSSAGSAGHVDSEAEEGEVPDEGELHPLVTVTNINPDEIPDVPPNRFLYRGERQTSINNRSKMDRNPREHERRHRSRIRGITKSGRVIKGRGVFVSTTWAGANKIFLVFQSAVYLNLTFRGSCIVIYSNNKTNEIH